MNEINDLKLLSETATNDLTCLQNDINNLQNCLLFSYKKCSVITVSLVRNHERQKLIIGHNGIKHRSIARDFGLEVKLRNISDGLNMSKRESERQ